MQRPSTTTLEPEVVRAAIRSELWLRGELRWKLHEEQLSVYEEIRTSDSSRYVLEIARRWGKTWLLGDIAIETCLQNPGCRVVYGAPTLKHLEEFIIPTIEALTEDAPPECRPTFNQQTGHYTFPNGSYIHLFGADDKRKANRGRGPGAILAIFDECGFCPILKYVLRSVLKPQLLHTRRKKGTFHGRTLLGSTPAEEPDHDFTEIAERAEAQGSYARRTLYQNPRLTPEAVQAFLEDDAKEEGLTVEEYLKTDEFRREWMAERVTNKLLIVMGQDWELSREKSFALYESAKRPDFFDGMTVLDFGGNDPHAVHLGYWHFERAMLVVEEELLLRDGENTEELQRAIKEKETALWGVTKWEGTLRALQEPEFLDSVPEWLVQKMDAEAPKQPYVRWCDNDIQLARDLHQLHGLSFVPTAKDNKELQVNNLRVMFRAGQVAISPKLVHTHRHLSGTVWKDAKRRDYRRKAGEHGDLLDTLIYMARNINRQRNPEPKDFFKPEPRRVVLTAQQQKDRALAEAFARASPFAKALRGR